MDGDDHASSTATNQRSRARGCSPPLKQFFLCVGAGDARHPTKTAASEGGRFDVPGVSSESLRCAAAAEHADDHKQQDRADSRDHQAAEKTAESDT